MKWFEEFKAEKEKAIKQAEFHFCSTIYVYVQETLEQEEFEWLKEYAQNHNFCLNTLPTLSSDYGEIDQILTILKQDSTLKDSWNQEMRKNILDKLQF